ncbi:hypothetical protein ACFWMP_19450 [Paenibacillus sp. NPDC058367]|uniref:hypothetical protein n=1 Tax=Paenibacillus sp. NPDC058367 TaxID=3346460 RepID=UPI0036522B34
MSSTGASCLHASVYQTCLRNDECITIQAFKGVDWKTIKKLSSDILNKISIKISVTLQAFNPDYYQEDLKTFTICGITSNVNNFVILAPSYRIQMNLKVLLPKSSS